jgi:Ni,Fe-hydrogenase III large subunit
MMKGARYIEILSNPGSVKLTSIPVLPYPEFIEQTAALLHKENCHCLDYFAIKGLKDFEFYILIANDESHKVLVYSHRQEREIKELDSITLRSFQLHVFERAIWEKHGIHFTGHPWLKPLRYPNDRADKNSNIADYPFYSIESEETHEVGVGPIHAGIIEPGHFRFLCYGEKVLHLEIQLGYQHRGIKQLFPDLKSHLQRSILAENIAGDTSIGHSLAWSLLYEALSGSETDSRLSVERTIALELERIAVHIGDVAALCGDVAYQPGQAACEALRTVVINTTQDWCGNRFGKGLIRPSGSNYPLTAEKAKLIHDRMVEVRRRFTEVTSLIFNDSGVTARFENCGTVSARQAFLVGAVGMAARSSGIQRDTRRSHPFLTYVENKYTIPRVEGGDVMARAMLRKAEVLISMDIIDKMISDHSGLFTSDMHRPDYTLPFLPDSLGVSLVEGWRGEICHSAITSPDGSIINYEVKDPSLHNWHLLAIALRDHEISDFPVNNKSFNLSYCGNDL